MHALFTHPAPPPTPRPPIAITPVDTPAALDEALSLQSRVLGSHTLRAAAYTRDAWITRMAHRSDWMLCARHHGRIVGIAFLREGTHCAATIGPVAVDPEYRHRGIGRNLLVALAARARAAGLARLTLGARISAEGFYLRCGFSPYVYLQVPGATLHDLRRFAPNAREVLAVEDARGARRLLDLGRVDHALMARVESAFKDRGPTTQTVMILHLDAENPR